MTKTDNRWTLEEFEIQIADMMDAAYKTPVERKSATMKARASRITPGMAGRYVENGSQRRLHRRLRPRHHPGVTG